MTDNNWKMNSKGVLCPIRNISDKRNSFISEYYKQLLELKPESYNNGIDHLTVRYIQQISHQIYFYRSENVLTNKSYKNSVLFYCLNDFLLVIDKVIDYYQKQNKNIVNSLRSIESVSKKLEKSNNIKNNSKYLNNIDGRIKEILKELNKNRKNVSVFVNDYGKIVSCSSLRRLKRKTQIFPLEEESDYPRTRLTHSMEVESVVRRIVAEMCNNTENIDLLRNEFKIENILSSAALIHDIGNPPFGHFGESVIRNYYKENWNTLKLTRTKGKKEEKIKINKLINSRINKQMYYDFINFDGNAESLRIMARLQKYRNNKSIEISTAVLGSIIKYPYSSINGKDKKKIGYFYSENKLINRMRNCNTFIDKKRNPLTLLLEVADDIAYNLSDFEDGIKKKLIKKEDFDREMYLVYGKSSDIDRFINEFYVFYSSASGKRNEEFFYRVMMRMIDNLKKELIYECAKSFVDNYDLIMDGIKSDGKIYVKNTELMEFGNIYNKNVFNWIKKEFVHKYVHKSDKVLYKELFGENVIHYLLEELTNSVLKLDFSKTKGRYNLEMSGKKYEHEYKIFNLISKNYIDNFFMEYDDAKNESEMLYYRLRLVVDFISGMSDEYALSIYRSLKNV